MNTKNNNINNRKIRLAMLETEVIANKVLNDMFNSLSEAEKVFTPEQLDVVKSIIKAAAITSAKITMQEVLSDMGKVMPK